jgi:hypothetical protein
MKQNMFFQQKNANIPIKVEKCIKCIKIAKKCPHNQKLPKKCKIELVPLSSAWHRSNFYRNRPRIQALNKKMQMHQVPGPSHL